LMASVKATSSSPQSSTTFEEGKLKKAKGKSKKATVKKFRRHH